MRFFVSKKENHLDENGNNIVDYNDSDPEDCEKLYKRTTYKGYNYLSTADLPKLARPGYEFLGYSLNRNGTGTLYTTFAGLTIRDNASVTLYPVWTQRTHTVRYVFGSALQNSENVVRNSDKALKLSPDN